MSERPKSPQARLFFALDLPKEMRAGIVRWGERELSDPALRPVPEESLHITLAFLGNLPEKEVEPLGEVIGSLTAPAPTIALSDPVARPVPKQARLFALPVESPGALTLRSQLEEKLVAAHLYEPEQRPFWPHITVARVKAEGRGSRRRPLPVEKAPGKLSQELLRPTLGVRVRLYRSELNPMGARYTPLAQVELSR